MIKFSDPLHTDTAKLSTRVTKFSAELAAPHVDGDIQLFIYFFDFDC